MEKQILLGNSLGRVIGFEAGSWASGLWMNSGEKLPVQGFITPSSHLPFLSGAGSKKTGLLPGLPVAGMLAEPLPWHKPGFHPTGEEARTVRLSFYFK